MGAALVGQVGWRLLPEVLATFEVFGSAVAALALVAALQAMATRPRTHRQPQRLGCHAAAVTLNGPGHPDPWVSRAR